MQYFFFVRVQTQEVEKMWWKVVGAAAIALLLGWLIYTRFIRAQPPTGTTPVTGAEASATAQQQATSPVVTPSEPPKGVVYELEANDLEHFVTSTKDGELAIVMFFAPWCGYSRKMIPEFSKAASASGGGKSRRWGQMDVEKFKEVADKLKIEAFPTTIVFDRGQIKQVLSGAQVAEALVAL